MIEPAKLHSLTEKLQPQLVAWRRDFHQYPELAYQEFRSSEQIFETLQQLQYDPVTGIAGTGLIAHITGRHPSPRVMLRFDMDALPIVEETGAEYASMSDGVMHACGHDGHMAIGLGVAGVLREIEKDLPGSAVLLFQPAEEGKGGAQRMIAEGALEKVSADYAIGMHLWNGQPVGWLGVSRGACMAGADSFEIRLTGKGGHGAVPHLAYDPILAAAHIITALQSIISRKVDPIESAVLSITQIHAGDAFNVIPSEVLMHGTIRAFSNEARELIITESERIIKQQAESFHCQADLIVNGITPPLINNPSVTDRIVDRFAIVQPDLAIDKEYQVLGSDDMALFLEEVPGCYFFLGSANRARGLDASHHNPRFDFDESILSQAVFLCVQATLTLMEQI